MAIKNKPTGILDWHGNPIPGIYRRRGKSKLTFKVEEDRDGTKWWRAYTADGKPGDRLPVDGPDAPYLQVTSDGGEVLYDSRREPPTDAEGGEKQLKRACRPQ